MYEFCVDCPVRGECVGPIDDVITMQGKFRAARFATLLTKCYDEERNGSALFHTEVDALDIRSSVNVCASPTVTEESAGILSKRTVYVKTCTALDSRPTHLTWFEEPFDRAVKEESGEAAIEDVIYEIETKPFVRRVILPLGALTLAGIGLGSAGIAEESIDMLAVGAWMALIGMFGEMAAIIRLAKYKPQ